VRIYNQSILLGKDHNFDIKDSSENENFGYNYDFGSVMHYGSIYFGKPCTTCPYGKMQTIITLPEEDTFEWDQTIGSSLVGASMTDYKVMNALYNCDALCEDNPKTCYGGGYQNPNDCDSCICPPGVGGDTCLTPVASPMESGYAPPGLANICSGGGTISVPVGNTWISMTKSIGLYGWAGTADNDVAWCHWYLRAPTNYHMEIEVTAIGGSFGNGCPGGFTEIRVSPSTTTSDWATTGRRFCAEADLEAQGSDRLSFQSIGRGAIVSSYALSGGRSFTLRYRAQPN